MSAIQTRGLRLPARGSKARLLAIGYGILIFLWLGPEDSSILPVTLLGAGFSLLLVSLWTLGKFGGQAIPARYVFPVVSLLGAITGVGASVSTTGLMFFKTARHAHFFPDYTPELMLAMLGRAPLWGLAGALIGLALAFAWLALSAK